MQWIEYHLYAGVERVYWYDMARADYESQVGANMGEPGYPVFFLLSLENVSDLALLLK